MTAFLFTAVLFCAQGAVPPPPSEAASVTQEESVNVEHPQVKEARLVREALAAFLKNKKNRVKTYKGKLNRFRLHSDYKSSRDPKKVIKACEGLLKTFDWALGDYLAPDVTRWVRDDHPFEVVIIQKEDAYFNLIDNLLEFTPERLHPYLRSRKNGTGFTLYPAKLTVYFNNVKTQEEARLDQSTAHNISHLEMHRRYSYLPLWLTEGVACAMEELTFGEIWANWNRDGFVYSVSHAAWRGPATQSVVAKMNLDQLWAYSADPYQDDLAHLSYGFAIFALESQPVFFHKLALAIQSRYDKHPEQGGQFKISASEVASIVKEVYGENLQRDFRAYWETIPKAPNVKKKRKVELGKL
jgi:hypothetical protein